MARVQSWFAMPAPSLRVQNRFLEIRQLRNRRAAKEHDGFTLLDRKIVELSLIPAGAEPCHASLVSGIAEVRENYAVYRDLKV